jgi:hypothetical protein
MTPTYVIGVGGTGAKCLESLIHLCAAGIFEAEQLRLLFVDPDSQNGNVERAMGAIRLYLQCAGSLATSNGPFQARVEVPPEVWSPIRPDSGTLSDSLNSAQSGIQRSALRHLLDALYSNEDKSLPATVGFRGRPDIATGLLFRCGRLDDYAVWRRFLDLENLNLKSGPEPRFVVIGSSFGGTGAAIVPWLPHMIKECLQANGVNRSSFNLVLLLPYFQTDESSSESVAGPLSRTKETLRYYSQHETLVQFDAVYLLGESELSPVRFTSVGGSTQVNDPHFIELLASLAVVNCVKDISHGIKTMARKDPAKLSWEDLPFPEGSNALRDKIMQMTRFAFAYLGVFHPVMEYLVNTRHAYSVPWYVEYFQRLGADSTLTPSDPLTWLRAYCAEYLGWLAGVHESSGAVKVDLIRCSSFFPRSLDRQRIGDLSSGMMFRLKEFGHLDSSLTKSHRTTINQLWLKMCDTKPDNLLDAGARGFASTLYRECK